MHVNHLVFFFLCTYSFCFLSLLYPLSSHLQYKVWKTQKSGNLSRACPYLNSTLLGFGIKDSIYKLNGERGAQLLIISTIYIYIYSFFFLSISLNIYLFNMLFCSELEMLFQAPTPASFTGLDHFSIDHHLMKPRHDRISESGDNNNGIMVDYMLHNPNSHHHQQVPSNLSFADVMQFADFGPKLALNQTNISEEYQETGMIDPVYFLKFPVLNNGEDKEEEDGNLGDEDQTRVSDNSSVKLRFIGEEMGKKSVTEGGKNKRKRPRSVKTNEEVESQRMTHIAVERNRRKQMNEHLRVLRSLMPGSYVQRGDQASIIGGAIEFVRELEQLLQCLESQKRRRLYGESPPTGRQVGDNALLPPVEVSSEMEEETAESKSGIADVEVKVVGMEAMIKILSRRRGGQLVKTIAALQDLHLNILHTNITTIEQTVLYSFSVKVGSEVRFTAEDIASSVQQIFTFIHANATM